MADRILDIRLLGDERNVGAFAARLEHMDGVEVLHRSGPRFNRRDAGVRVSLTVQIAAQAAGEDRP